MDYSDESSFGQPDCLKYRKENIEIQKIISLVTKHDKSYRSWVRYMILCIDESVRMRVHPGALLDFLVGNGCFAENSLASAEFLVAAIQLRRSEGVI